MTNTLAPILPSSLELGEIVEQVWESFLGGGVVAASGDSKNAAVDDQMVAWVAISGDWTGHMKVVTSRECAYQIAAEMFMMESDQVDITEVADALGEIANMVGGSIKSMVGVACTLSLPQVVLDASALISPDSQVIVGIAAEWKGHAIDFSLWERTDSASVNGAIKGD